MRTPFQRDPTRDISTGVNELLRRFPDSREHDTLFWRMHGSEKLRLWLNGASQYRGETTADAEAISLIKRELSAVAGVLEALPAERARPSEPDCIRGLVFSNCITWDAQRHFRSPAEMWETYVNVLQIQHLLPHIAAQPSAGNESVSRRRLSVAEAGAALTTALETLGSAAAVWHVATTGLPRPTNRMELLKTWNQAAEMPRKVDAGLAGLAVALPPDEYMRLYEAFALASNALISKWQADLTAIGLLVTEQRDQAQLAIAEAERSKVEFYRFWRLFQVTFHAMEQEQPEAISRLKLTPSARVVIEKQDWFMS